MKRTPVNPWSWSLKFGFNQAEIIEGHRKQLICAGQTSIDSEGNPQHPNDMRAQMILALENLKAVLAEADMSLADVVQLKIYSTDMGEMMNNFDVFRTYFGDLDIAPPMSVLGVTRLALPPLMFEIDATAFS